MKTPSTSIISLSDAVKNIHALVGNASYEDFQAGLAWYSTAHTEAQIAAGVVGADFETFCKVVAVLSPLTKWQNNIGAAQSIYRQHSAGVSVDDIKPTKTRFYANNRKAYGVIDGTVEFKSSGTGKTFSFFQNIYNPTSGDFITVDFHAYNGAVGPELAVSWEQYTGKGFKVNPATYLTISDAVREVARQFNIYPLQCQAISWLAQKRIVESK